ncbi:hypothetical protein CF319_g5921 [Tilletia indica]|nr:hypothetical protein CF319_g5921 [Tilletia indica]
MRSGSTSRSSVTSTVMRQTSHKHQRMSYDVEAIIARRRARMAALRVRHEQEQVLLALQADLAGMCLTDANAPGPPSPAEEGTVAHDASRSSPVSPKAA